MSSLVSVFTNITIDGFPLWIVLLISLGVFLASFMDAIAGGGGIISVPTYLIAFSGLPTYYALGTNKFSSCIGTIFSTARFIRQGYVDWKLFAPAPFLALAGGMAGALYGYDSIPEEWLNTLMKRDYIEEMCKRAYRGWQGVSKRS